jgi:hypothetical protein
MQLDFDDFKKCNSEEDVKCSYDFVGFGKCEAVEGFYEVDIGLFCNPIINKEN